MKRFNFKWSSKSKDNFFEDIFFNNTFIMMFIEISTGNIIYANAAAINFYGYSEKEFEKLSIFDINITNSKTIKNNIEVAKSEKQNMFILDHRLKNGEIKRVEVYSKASEFKNKKVLFSIIHDMSEVEKFKKEYEEIEKNRKLVYDNILESSNGIMYGYSTKKEENYLSGDIKGILGYSIEDFKKNQNLWLDLVYEEDREKILEAIEKAKQEERLSVEFRAYTKKREIKYFRTKSIQVKKCNGKDDFLIEGIAFDITEEKKRGFQLEIERDKAKKANEAKSNFIANMSHELRTPLNGILGFSSLLLEDKNLSLNDSLEMLEIIKQSGENLLELVNKILDISAIEKGILKDRVSNVNLTEFVEKLKRKFASKIEEKNIDFIIDIAPNIPKELAVDTIKLSQIMINILSNAIKFTENGTVELKIQSLYEHEEQLRLKIEIKDTGIGIKKNVKDKVFDQFMQGEHYLTKEYSGTGLGLNISKKLVEIMNGDIYFESEEGLGTKFSIEIDVKIVKRENSIKKMKKEILVVEDNLVNIKYIEKILEKNGYEFETVKNGNEFLNVKEIGSYKLILMDIQMPDINGIDLTKILREKGIKTPIIAMTAFAMKEEKEVFLTSGMNDYISKPFKIEELLKIIEKNISE